MKDLAKKTPQELSADITTLATKQREARFGGAGAQAKNTKGLRSMRRSTARLKTALRTSQLAESAKNA